MDKHVSLHAETKKKNIPHAEENEYFIFAACEETPEPPTPTPITPITHM